MTATKISIHALREEGDPSMDISLRAVEISIHALREEGDSAQRIFWRYDTYFYPRPPRGGRRIWSVLMEDEKMISIHALREEGDLLLPSGLSVRKISIHALREEGDLMMMTVRGCSE